jgi:PAS domain S-box-containing protein
MPTTHDARDPLEQPARVSAAHRVLMSVDGASGLDRLVQLAADLLGVSSAQVSLLLERDQVVPAATGLGSTGRSDAEDSLCTATLRSGGALVVPDAAAEPRVAGLPPVTSGVVGAYCGVPLRVGGQDVGVLCAFDEQRHAWSERDLSVLEGLASSAAAELELRLLSEELSTQAARLDLALTASEIGTFDLHLPTGRLVWDDRLLVLFGYTRGEFSETLDDFNARLHPDDVPRVAVPLQQALDTVGDFAEEYRVVRPDGTRWVQARGRALPGPDGRTERFLGVAYDITELRESRERLEQAVVERERAYATAESANRRLALLADASAALAQSLEPRQVLQQLADVVLPELGEWIAVALAPDSAGPLIGRELVADDRLAHVVHVVHADPVKQPFLEQLLSALPITLDDPAGSGAVMRTGRAEWLGEVPDAVLQHFGADDPDLLAGLRSISPGSALTAPLISRGRVLGAVTVAEPASGSVDRALVVDLVARAAVALDNALAYGAERRTGLTLQRSLLPGEVPKLPGVEVAVRYLPGEKGAFVGGDWYQGVVVGNELVLAMGDVMGHGMRSAARMGQLRAIVATLALEGHTPGQLLSRLAGSTEALLDLELATLLVARYCPVERRLTVASAGHPPPLLASPGVRPAYVEVVPGPPIGSVPGTYDEVVLEVPPVSTLVLYTDGLVEERGASLDAGLEQLRQALDELRLPPEAVADHVLAALGRRDGALDDVALLVMSHLADDA